MAVKIESFRFLPLSEFPTLKTRNTARAGMLNTIVENIMKCPAGQGVCCPCSELDKFERFSIQKALQSRGKHVTVQESINAQKKPMLWFRPMTDEQWKEHLEALRARDERRAAKKEKKPKK